MKYTVKTEDLPVSLNKKIQDFVKQYPHTKVYRFDLTEKWRPRTKIHIMKFKSRFTKQIFKKEPEYLNFLFC